MKQGAFELSVNIGGANVTEYHHHGETMIEAIPNMEYELVVRSQLRTESKVVLSVDGLDVLTGKPASLTDISGYIIPAFGSMSIPGWRLNNDAVAKFKFGYRPYAEHQGGPQNVGVIGAAFFLKKEKPRYVFDGLWRDGYSDISGSPTRGRGGMKTMGIGTEFGREQTHRVRNVEFEAEDSPRGIITLRYDTREGLESLGIRVRGCSACGDRLSAQAFPGLGCVPPPGWSGR